MVNIPSIFAVNGMAVMLLFSLLFNTNKRFRYSLIEDKVIFFMIFLNILQCLIEPASFVIIGKMFDGCYEISLVLNALLFINNIIFCYLWTVYVNLKLYPDAKVSRFWAIFRALPAAGVVICSLANLFTDVFFRITESNIYERTVFIAIPYVISYMYLAYGAINIFMFRKKMGKYYFLPVLLFLAPVVITSVLQYFVYGLSLIWAGTAIGLTSVFINIQKETSFIDILSGLYTREYVNRYIDKHLGRGNSEDKKLAGILLDIDRFKGINDIYGHLEGDAVIRKVGKLLRDNVPKHGLASRYAGDEFVIIIPVNGEDDVRDMIARISRSTQDFNKSENKPYNIEFSFGFSILDSVADSIDDFLGRMDNMMYDEKKEKYALYREQGGNCPDKNICGCERGGQL